MSLISQRVELARQGANDKVICRMASGWAVMGDVQFLEAIACCCRTRWWPA